MYKTITTKTKPHLNSGISLENFLAYYWLKKELVKFCRDHGLSTNGSKQEITDCIKWFISHKIISSAKHAIKSKQLNKNKLDKELDLHNVIPVGFRCTLAARNFLVHHAGSSFKYTVRLQRYLKDNPGITFLDLLLEYKRQEEEKKAGFKNSIDVQFEYNQFTRDFFADPNNNNKTRAQCIKAWKIVKNLPGSHNYEAWLRYSANHSKFY